jgi:chitinase
MLVHPVATDIYTHLYFSFASIDPSTFKIKPWEEADIALIKEFTKLKTAKLQTWIAVGGYTFNDPGPTHTTWSDLCASAQARAAFIQSTKDFMLEYGFQGVVSPFHILTSHEVEASSVGIVI